MLCFFLYRVISYWSVFIPWCFLHCRDEDFDMIIDCHGHWIGGSCQQVDMDFLFVLLLLGYFCSFVLSDQQGTILYFDATKLVQIECSLVLWKLQCFSSWCVMISLISGDALIALKFSLNASGEQLTDWNENQVNPCTWSRINCNQNNIVFEV